jgi:hypothetical protein
MTGADIALLIAIPVGMVIVVTTLVVLAYMN